MVIFLNEWQKKEIPQPYRIAGFPSSLPLAQLLQIQNFHCNCTADGSIAYIVGWNNPVRVRLHSACSIRVNKAGLAAGAYFYGSAEVWRRSSHDPVKVHPF